MPDRPNASSDHPPLPAPQDSESGEGHDSRPVAPQPGLVLVATPIGNLGDMTARAIATLRDARFVLCEDTRTTARLLSAFGVSARLLTLHEHNEDARIPEAIAALQDGATVALVSDAGTPLVSDPGYRLVRAAIAAELPVTAAPGANAATTALLLSGLPPLPHLMLGFPPPKQAARLAAFRRLRDVEQAGLSATLIWYEAPHRLAATLADLAAVFGDRPAAVAREMTKRFEEVRRATLPDLASHYHAHAARGEITIVIGAPPEETAWTGDLDAALREALAGGSVKDAVARVAGETGLPRRTVYARALELAK